MRYLIHLGTGGMTHMLRLLGNSLAFARTSDRLVVPVTEGHSAFRLPFYEVFESRHERLATEQQAHNALSNYVPPAAGLPPSPDQIRVRAVIRDFHEVRDAPELPHGFLALDWREADAPDVFVLTSGQVEEAGGNSLGVRQGLLEVIPALSVRRRVARAARDRRAVLPDKYIGVHFRNTDMKHDLTETLSEVSRVMRDSGITDIYWATDDRSSLDTARLNLSEAHIHHSGAGIDVKGQKLRNLHYLSDDVLQQHGTDKRTEITTVLTDIHLLASSAEFIASRRSSLSSLVTLLRSDLDLWRGFYGEMS